MSPAAPLTGWVRGGSDSSSLIWNVTLDPISTLLSDDFEQGFNSFLWDNYTGSISDLCGSSGSGINALRFNDANDRTAQTNFLNTNGGGTISFDLMISEGTTPCESADTGEDVVLEYSISGNFWYPLGYYAVGNYSTFTPITAICPGETLNPLPTVSNNGINGTWSPALNNMTTTTYTFTPTTGQCATTAILDVTVNPLPIINSGVDEEICVGSSTQLNATGGVSYSWSPLVNIINPETANPTVSPTANTTYVVVGTDANQCSNIDSIIVNVFSLQTINDTSICIGEELQLNVIGPISASYSWTPSTALSNTTIPNPITTTTTDMTYVVTVQDINGCVATESVFIAANTKPVVDFGMSVKPGCDGILVEFNNLNINANSYLWSFGDGEQSSEINPNHMFQYGAEFTTILEATGLNGCLGSQDSIINSGTFEEQFKIEPPSVFSPNNDGINDVFQLDIAEEMASCVNLQIFNRWGSKIFISEGQNVAWDGRTTAAKKVPAGTYFYILEINGTVKKGSLTLLE